MICLEMWEWCLILVIFAGALIYMVNRNVRLGFKVMKDGVEVGRKMGIKQERERQRKQQNKYRMYK